MDSSRIKDPALATRIDEGQLAWQRYVTPIIEHYCRQIAQRDYRGKKLACWQHITLNTIPMLLALKEAGADITLVLVMWTAPMMSSRLIWPLKGLPSMPGKGGARPSTRRIYSCYVKPRPITCVIWAAS